MNVNLQLQWDVCFVDKTDAVTKHSQNLVLQLTRHMQYFVPQTSLGRLFGLQSLYLPYHYEEYFLPYFKVQQKVLSCV